MLLRPGASRALLRGLPGPSARSVRPLNGSLLKAQLASRHSTWTSARPQLNLALARKPLTTALVRHISESASKLPLIDKIDYAKEAEWAKQKIESSPETVSTQSSMHPVFGELAPEDEKTGKTDGHDMMASLRSDLRTIKETFTFEEVPRDAYLLGMAGVLPYLATSMSTVFCAWEIERAAATGMGFIFSQPQAHHLLMILEPLQVGYGAVILSFLGAIHWGFEWAGYGGHHARKRYGIGVIAPAVAWPTLLLPAETALISQFLAFTFLYHADAEAARDGRAPPWYGIYRFVLTFVVGTSIIISLIGRSRVDEHIERLPSPLERARDFPQPKVNADEAIMLDHGEEGTAEESEE